MPVSAGFTQAADGATIRIEALSPRGDPLEQVSSPVPAGLLAIDLARRMRARINGMLRRRATGFTLDVEQAYPNCMKYIQRREFTQGDPGPAGSGALPGPATMADHLSAQDTALVRAADTMFIATTAPTGSDVSHRGGRPGFIEITGPTTGTQAPGASSPSPLAASSGAPPPCPSGTARRSTRLSSRDAPVAAYFSHTGLTRVFAALWYPCAVDIQRRRQGAHHSTRLRT